MSVTIRTEIHCDQCGNWEDQTTGTRPDARHVRAWLKTKGWKFKAGIGDLCDRCVATWKEVDISDGGI